MLSHRIVVSAAFCVLSTLTLALGESLSDEAQVGQSFLGKLDQAYFPKWLGDSESACPWPEQDSAAAASIPQTNVTRRYHWTLSRGQLSPDGVLRDVILVNQQYPGPLVEANWGDWIEIQVENNITSPDEGASIHWHGSLQTKTPWADGVPGVSQCPIAPGSSHTYRFRAEVYGTSFWHSHYSAQYTGGVAGPIQIYGPTQLDYDFDLGPVMLTDWYHIPYYSVVQNILGTDYSKLPPTSDSGLINGRGRFDCSVPSYSNETEWVGDGVWSNKSWTCIDNAPYSSFRFRSGRTHRLRLINHGADGIQKFAIDGHQMTVISVDYVPIKPYVADIVTLGVGQRTDVLVTANGQPESSYWMRSQMPGGAFCGGNDNTQAIRAAIYYEAADTTLEPQSTSSDNNAACVNDDLALTEPLHPIHATKNVFQQDVVLAMERNGSGSFVWTVNGVSSFADMNQPLLFENLDEPPVQANLFNFGKNDTVILNITNTTPFQHPVHLHGYHFQVLASGPASATSVFPAQDANPLQPAPATVWDGTLMGNRQNPTRRDTQILPALGFVALQFNADNPGVWPLHCHTAWHQSGGMSMNLVTRPDDLPKLLPEDARASACTAWNDWSQGHVSDQIDAGS